MLLIAQLCGNVQGHLQLRSSVQLFDIVFVVTKFSFYGAVFKRILASFHSCRTRVVCVALVSFVSHSRRTHVAPVWYTCEID